MIFFDIKEDIEQHGRKKALVEQLKEALKAQVQVLRPAVELHGRKCSEPMRPLHQHMRTSFEKLQEEMDRLLAS